MALKTLKPFDCEEADQLMVNVISHAFPIIIIFFKRIFTLKNKQTNKKSY